MWKARFPLPRLIIDPDARQAKPAADAEEDNGVHIILQQAVSLTFSLKYLQNFAKSAPLASHVVLNMSNEVPLLVAFEFEQGHINFYLAPKVSCARGHGRPCIELIDYNALS